ncbi:hypothetical protein ACQ4WX_19190 [Streptomyces lasalocidi]
MLKLNTCPWVALETVSWKLPSPGIATDSVMGLVTLTAVEPEGQTGGGGGGVVWHPHPVVGGFVWHTEHPDVGGFVWHTEHPDVGGLVWHAEHPDVGAGVALHAVHGCAARGTAWADTEPTAMPNAAVAVRPAPTSPAPQPNRRDCVLVRAATRMTSTPPHCLGTRTRVPDLARRSHEQHAVAGYDSFS